MATTIADAKSETNSFLAVVSSDFLPCAVLADATKQIRVISTGALNTVLTVCLNKTRTHSHTHALLMKDTYQGVTVPDGI